MRGSALIKIAMVMAVTFCILFSCGGEEGEKPQIQPLEIITNRLPEAVYGREYYFTLSATGGFQPYRWELVGKLPEGITFDSRNGVLSGTVKENARGSVFEIKLYDSQRKENPIPVIKRYTIKVISRSFVASEELEILTKNLPQAEHKAPYEVYLAATGGIPPYQWKMEGELPESIKFNGSKGLIKGVPQEVGIWQPAFSLSDVMGKEIAQKAELELIVKEKALVRGESFPPLKILTDKILPGIVGNRYAAYLSATGGAPPYHWKAESRLPEGINLNEKTGEISGIPAKSGKYELKFSARDERATTASTTSLTLQVLPPPINRVYPLKIITQSIPKAVKGKHYSIALSAQGGMLPYRWTCLTPLPSGITLDKRTGILSGTSQITGPYILKIELADSSTPPSAVWRKLNLVIEEPEEKGGFSLTTLIVILIGIGFIVALLGWISTLKGKKEIIDASKLEILTQELPPAQTGEQYCAVFTAKGGITPYLWDNENPLPPGFTIEKKRGALIGEPTEEHIGQHPIDIILYDSDSPSNKVYRHFILDVKPPETKIEKKVFTIVAREDKIFFEEFPPGSDNKLLVSSNDIGKKTSPFLTALRRIKAENKIGNTTWVIYCHTEYQSGVDVAFKAGEMAKELGINFYTVLKQPETS